MKTKHTGNKKVSQTLIKAFVCVSIITAIVGGIGIYGITTVKAAEEDMYSRRLVSMTYLTDTMRSLASIQAVSRDIIVFSDDADTLKTDQDTMKKYDEMYRKNSAALIQTITSKDWADKLRAAEKSYENDYFPKMEELFEKVKTDPVGAKENLQSTRNTNVTIAKSYSDFMEYRVSVAAQQNATDSQKALALNIAMVAVSLLGFVSSIVIGLRIARSIKTPVEELVNVVDQFASDGKLDMEIKYHSNNEFGQLANSLRAVFIMMRNMVTDVSGILTKISENDISMGDLRTYTGDWLPISVAINSIVDQLNVKFANFQTAAEQVSSGSNQIASGAQELAQGATEQASSLEELSASIAEVSNKSNENRENVNTVSKYIGNAAEDVEHGNQQMQSMLSAMKEIEFSSNEISKIIKVIDGIAFQTNILALNAAVEAARAGEAGKGFAVVADEVRNLASKSADAAKQTTQLIQTSIDKVQGGTVIVDSTAKALESIAAHMVKINAFIDKIDESSTEQANAINEITLSVEQVSSVVQTNSATAEESAAASEELSSQADMLSSVLSLTKLRSADKPNPVSEDLE